MDPRHAPGVGTPVPAGLTQREAHVACELAGETGKLIGMDIVEVNAILDVQNQTAALAVEYVLSALGKRIWNADLSRQCPIRRDRPIFGVCAAGRTPQKSEFPRNRDLLKFSNSIWVCFLA